MLSSRVIIKRPIVTEQSMKLAALGFYTFEVTPTANKQDIAHLVAKKFNVEVVSVRTINTKGKIRTQRTRRGFYSTPATKKAVIKVKKGQKIALFEAIMNPQAEEATVVRAEPEIKEKKSLLKGTKVKIEKGVTGKETKKGEK